jgi:4-amino-4-deoxy-L-arabinose transferase-like glycosyltransferase
MALTVATKKQRYLRVRRQLAAVPKPLAALLGVALILSLAWSTATAPLNGPDETAHVSYAQNLAENGHKPAYATGSGTESTEVASADYFFGLHPSVGVPGSRPNWSKADVAAFAKTEKGFTASERKNAGGPNAIAKNPVLYYVWQAGVYRVGSGLSVLDRVYLMRLANIPLFLLTVTFTWLLAGLLFRSVWAQTTATALVALQPMAAFMSGVVNPDTLLATVWAAFAYVGVRLVLLGPSRGRVTATLALLLASFLTHGRGIALIVPGVLAILLSLWRHRDRYPRAARVMPAVVVAVAVAGAVVLTHRAAYSNELTLGVHFKLTGFLTYLWQFYLPPLSFMSPPPGPSYGFHELMVREFFAGQFGSLEVNFSPWVYAVTQFVVLLLIAGLVAAVTASWRQLARVWDVVLLLVTIVVSELLLLHLVSYRSLAAQTGDPLIVGRYLIPLCAVYGVTCAFIAWAAGPRAGRFVAAGLVGMSLALQLGGLAITVGRFYG